MTKISNQYGLTNLITADLTNSRIGINNASPSYSLDVTGTIRLTSALTTNIASGLLKSVSNVLTQAVANTDYQSPITLTTTGTSGAATFSSNTLNIPQYQSVLTNPVTGTGTTNYVSKWTSSTGIGNSLIYDNGSNAIGIGVTTKAWDATFTALQLGQSGCIWANTTGYGIQFGGNAFFDGSSYKYIVSDFATRYIQSSGVHNWFTAPSGTAGNSITFTESMRIKSDGQVIIGDSSMAYTNADGHPFGVKSTGSQCFISLAYAGQTLATGGLSVGITTAAAYYFVRDFVPIIFATGNNERMRMLANGNLSLGTTSDVGAKIYIVSSTSYGIVYQNSSNTNNFYVGVGGDGYLRASAWSYGSDIRMKENISDVSNGLDLVTKLKPKHFDYINGIKNNLGFIAQDVQELIPQAVSISDKKTGMLALKTDFIIPYLVKAIQELSAKVSLLENK